MTWYIPNICNYQISNSECSDHRQTTLCAWLIIVDMRRTKSMKLWKLHIQIISRSEDLNKYKWNVHRRICGIFFALMGRLSVFFSMKLLLAAGRLKKKRSWFHYMLWTCNDEHLLLEKFTKYFISFREQTLIKFCDPSFLSIRKDQSWLQRFQWRCRKWD